MLLQLLKSQGVKVVWSSVDWAGRMVDRVVDRVVGKGFVAGRTITNSVAIHDYKFCGKTRSLGLVSTAVDIAGP